MLPTLETDPGLTAAVESGVEEANTEGLTEEQKAAIKAEENTVAELWADYENARVFDKEARAQYAVDRRYAAGTANLDFAVSANLIGAFIDILVSFLYARNPDVSVRKAPRVDNSGSAQFDDFAKTMEIMISSLWKAPTSRLKQTCRAQVRSVLTNGVGWLKVIIMAKGTNIPQMKQQLNDSRDNIARLEAIREKIAVAQDPTNPAYGGDYDGVETPEKIDAMLSEARELEMSLSHRMEIALRKALAIDFVSPEDMQISLDVREIGDHLSAGWNANAIYRKQKDLCAMFPRLTPEDLREATCYYQRTPRRDLTPLGARVKLSGIAGPDYDATEAEQYTSGESAPATGTEGEGIKFAKIVELWNRETGFVHTMIDGVKKWAKEPYQPDYATTRFFPYFNLQFYPVDGSRHAQSLAWRLMKLQDEYGSVRSNLRLTRQRATPGTLFNASGVDPEDMRKVENSTQQEFIGITPTNPDTPLRDLFAEKPVAIGDARLYDTSPIMSDMERISGVQEALQASITTEKTATEAEIQQSGFASRTTADRDVLETMLTDLANYTGELALGALDMKDATRIAGDKAFWPFGMAIDDLLSMVEIEIEAGTTGKPRTGQDKEAWGVVLPILTQTIAQIQEARLTGNEPMAVALENILRETMVRMGDETDPARFIPQMPQLPPGMAAPGAVPGAAPLPGDPATQPPGGAPPPQGDAPVGDLVAPEPDPSAIVG